MSLSVRADTTQLMRSLQKLKQQQPGARKEYLQELATACASGFDAVSPQDTGRYRWGWMQACMEAGGDIRSLPMLKPSRRAQYIAYRIKQQWLATHIKRVKLETLFNKWYPSTRKLDQFGQDMQAQLRKLIRRDNTLLKQYEKWKLASDGPVIMIGKDSSHDYASLRTNVIGGKGAIVGEESRSKLKLTNKEPHAYIVESNLGVTDKVGAYIKSFGAKRLENRYKKKLAEARKEFEK